jgi:hypothetical protein
VSVVFVLGAGASYGESLAKLDKYPDAPGGPTPPPVINGFFKQSLFESIQWAASILARAAAMPLPLATGHRQSIGDGSAYDGCDVAVLDNNRTSECHTIF